jgi:hypothetical protein
MSPKRLFSSIWPQTTHGRQLKFVDGHVYCEFKLTREQQKRNADSDGRQTAEDTRRHKKRKAHVYMCTRGRQWGYLPVRTGELSMRTPSWIE